MIFPASVSFFANFWCKIGILVLVVLLILRFKKLYLTCSAFTLLFFLGFRTFRSFEKIFQTDYRRQQSLNPFHTEFCPQATTREENMQRDSGISLDHPPYSRRLIAATVDKIARDSPTRIYASVPISNTELSRGFRDITYAELAAAVDRTAYWLDEHLPAPPSPPTSTSSQFSSSSSDPEGDDASATSGIQTFAYYGPRDLRYIAFMCAAIKTGRRLLLTSILGSLEAQVYLAKAANCHLFLYAEGGADVVPDHVREIPKNVDGGISFAVPEFEDLFYGNYGQEQRRYPYEKGWDEGRFDEVVIYHTSGSSGFPKLVVHTNEMLARIDSWNLLKDVDGMTTNRECLADKRMWVGLPIFHLAGSILTLPCALFFSTTPVLSPPTAIPNPSLFAQMAAHARLDGILLPPSVLEDIVRAPALHALLRPLRSICFCGAPLAPAAGAFLAPLGSLRTCIGSTEGNYWPTLRVPAADWDYFAPHPAMGAAFEHRVDDLYELVVRRTPDALAFTNFFQAVDKMVVRGARARRRVPHEGPVEPASGSGEDEDGGGAVEMQGQDGRSGGADGRG